MFKAVLFDADGVALKKYHGYFSDRFAKEYEAPIDDLRTFFQNEFQLCQRGKADLKVELAKKLPQWNWPKDVDSFLEYWFSSDATADAEVLGVAKEFRNKGLKCYLATDQEKYRAQYLLESLDFKNKFDQCFFSFDLGYRKIEPGYFLEILKRTGLKPEEIAYVDDDQKNVDTAIALGINARLYKSIEDLGFIA
jgi:putative hydrolase of the HAD superfamily